MSFGAPVSAQESADNNKIPDHALKQPEVCRAARRHTAFGPFYLHSKHAENDETRENSGTDVQIVRDTWGFGGGKPIVPSPTRWFDWSSASRTSRITNDFGVCHSHLKQPFKKLEKP